MKKYLLIFTLLSCSGVKTIKKENRQCANRSHDIETRHLTIAAKIKSSGLSYCFLNYLKFEDNKKQVLSSCNQLSVQKSGYVGYVQVTGLSSKALPKDFVMCLTQEYKRMSFKNLQLSSGLTIKFPLTFSSI